MASHGWRNGWTLLEAIPTFGLGLLALWFLPDNPAKAKFLSPREKEVALGELAKEPRAEVHGLGGMFEDWWVWALMIPDFCIVFGIYALGLWMPQMIKAMGYSNNETGAIVMIPYLFSLLVLWGMGFPATAPASGRCISRLISADSGRRLCPRGDGHERCDRDRGFLFGVGRRLRRPLHLLDQAPLFLGGTAAAGAFALINSFRQSQRLSGALSDGLAAAGDRRSSRGL